MQGSTSLSATINQIAAASPNSLAALVGGQVVPEYYPTAKLTPGTELNTTDKVKNGNGSTVISVTVDPASVNGPVQVRPPELCPGLAPLLIEYGAVSMIARHDNFEACCAFVPPC